MKKQVVTLINRYHLLILILIFALFLYLRFYNIQFEGSTGFDQTRDAFNARELLHGKLILQGPWTGNGHLHIGPLYFYLLAIFFKIFNLDPVSANYLNILFNIFNFGALYFVFNKLFKQIGAIAAVSIFTFNNYFITLGRVAWNVTPMIGLAAIIFYSIIQVYKGKYKWILVALALSGIYFHAHYTALFLPFSIMLSLAFVKNKMKLLRYILVGIPLYLVWFIPNIVNVFIGQDSDAGRYKEFIIYFYHGFHWKFFLYELPYHFVLFGKSFSIFQNFFQFVIPIIYIMVIFFFEKDKREKITAYIIFCFFIVPILGFTLYAGTLSEYYYLHTVPPIIYILIYLQRKLLSVDFLLALPVIIIFWAINFYFGTQNQWIKQKTGGWESEKIIVRQMIKNGKKIPFNEGQSDSYLYTIWMEDGKRF